MKHNDYSKFQNLTFDKFRELAQNTSLSAYEKIGFPDSYRAGYEEKIFSDISNKLHALTMTGKTILDIGPGCSELPYMLIELCRNQKHSLILIDSDAMLNQLPNEPFITKINACYPQDCDWLFEKYSSKIDAILTYSVFHYIFAEGNIFNFVDKSLSLLSEQGEILIGDIPNISKRKRFFSSTAGIQYHQNFTGTDEIPQIVFNTLDVNSIDDSVLLSVIMRCRNFGFDAYLLPQANDLPMANRREDIYIRRPQ